MHCYFQLVAYLRTKITSQENKLDIFKIKYSWRRRQDGRVEGLELTSYHKNTKITANWWTTIDKKGWNLPKKVLYVQRQRRSHNEMVGGALLWYQIPYLPGGWHTQENNYITGALPQDWEFWAPAWGLASGGEAHRAFGFEGQRGLSAGAPQDWGKQRLHSWGAHTHTRYHEHWEPPQSSDSIGAWARPTCRS